MNSDQFYDLINEIANTSSKKAKVALLAQANSPDNTDLQAFLRAALDPGRVYYIERLDITTACGDRRIGLDDFDMLHRLSDRTLAGDAALNAIRNTMSTLTAKSQEVLRRIILKDLRAGIGVGTVNTAIAGLIFDPPYMRCSLPKDSNIDKWNWADGIIVQLKADGMFVNADVTDKVVFTSRQGKPFPPGALGIDANLLAAIPSGQRVMGELTVYCDGELLPRAEGNGILNHVAQGGSLPPEHVVVMDAWDMIPISAAVAKGTYDAHYDLRLAALDAGVSRIDEPGLHVIPTNVVYSRAEALKLYQHYLAQGLEGVICKHPHAIWKDGDSKDQVKLKLAVPVDLKIVGFREGTPGKRTEATFGALLCRTADDKLEVGVSGFKRDMEQYLHENRDLVLGKVVTVTANGVMAPSGEETIFSLFSPRFTELRADKLEADTLDSVIDQFSQAVA